MSSPRLGVVRKSMLSNPRLMKAPLGRARTPPVPDITFGVSTLRRDGGVAEVLSGWRVQSRHQDSPRRPDFVSLNREAVKSGLVTSKELSQYRAQRGGATAQGPAHKPPGGGASQWRASMPDITFGARNRTPSPISDVLTNQYARRWREEQLSRSQSCTLTHKVRAGCVTETRSSLLRRSRPLPVTPPPFTLPQYTQVGPALDTFRDPGARLRAFRARQVDSRSRRGPQGLGPYGLD